MKRTLSKKSKAFCYFYSHTPTKPNRICSAMPLKRKIYSHSLVLIGSFNPQIFQPAWLASEELVGKTEAEEATIKVIHPDISDFDVKNINVRVTRGQFLASTFQDGFFEILKDLVVGTFSVLGHTPANALGINQSMHIELPPKLLWNDYTATLVNATYWQEKLGEATMEDITYRRKRDNSTHAGYQRIRLQPSGRISQGLFFDFNDHYDLPEGNNHTGFKAVEIIEDQWQKSLANGQSLIEELLDKSL